MGKGTKSVNEITDSSTRGDTDQYEACSIQRSGPGENTLMYDNTDRQQNAYQQWCDQRISECSEAAELGGWVLDRQYVSKQGSTYLWFTCETALVKIRLSDHGIDYRKKPRSRTGRVATWSTNLVFRRAWQQARDDAAARLRGDAQPPSQPAPPPRRRRMRLRLHSRNVRDLSGGAKVKRSGIQTVRKRSLSRGVSSVRRSRSPKEVGMSCDRCGTRISPMRQRLLPDTTVCLNCDRAANKPSCS